MKTYQCHKRVRAAKIMYISDRYFEVAGGGLTSAILHLESGEHIMVDGKFTAKHNPQEGGYYVLYDDGYASWSPAAAFESGYSPVDA